KDVGTVLLHCALPSGETKSIELENLLYLPKLGYSLLAWFAAFKQGFLLAIDRNGQFLLLDSSEEVVGYTRWANDRHLYLVLHDTEYTFPHDGEDATPVLVIPSEGAKTKQKCPISPAEAESNANVAIEMAKNQAYRKWHEAFAHANFGASPDIYESSEFVR